MVLLSLLNVALLIGGVWGQKHGSVADYIRAGIGAGSPTDGLELGNSQEPCAQVASLVAGKERAQVPGSLALLCLRSVPLDSQRGLTQLDGLKAFLEFQSTLTYLKRPPPGYAYPATDIPGHLQQIRKHLQEGKYANEYDFQLAIYRVIQSAYDGHLGYTPSILKAFSWDHRSNIYSVSSDGLALPEIYLGEQDIRKLASLDGTQSFDIQVGISPVISIGGTDVETMINEVATLSGNSQDPDANYNTVFPSFPPSAIDGPLPGTWGGVYLTPDARDEQTVLFRNGSTKIITNYVYPATGLNFSGVIDGTTFYQSIRSRQEKLLSLGDQPKNETSQAPDQPARQPKSERYPEPAAASSDLSIVGYFPKNEPDLAVLKMPTFEPQDPEEFASTLLEFLESARARKAKKLVIDLRGNPGGDVMLASVVFEALFPGQQGYGSFNYRAHRLFEDVGKAVWKNKETLLGMNLSLSDIGNITTVGESVLSGFRDTNFRPFASWDDFYGPVQVSGDNFTNLARADQSMFTNDLPVSAPGLFRAEDILLIQDGVCASTCTLLSEFMKTQAGVKQVVFGGRKQYGPMQGVGGVKGAQIYKFKEVSRIIERSLDLVDPAEEARLNQTYWSTFVAMNVSMIDIADASMNVRNNIRKGDSSLTPLQFVYEAADCRLFYTASQLLHQEKVWTAAYDAIWGMGACVKDSTGHPTSKVLVGQQMSQTLPPPNFKNFFGASITSPLDRLVAQNADALTL